ncbi:phosphate ABC transporter permease subunit PstC [Pseudomonas sp. FW305-E2]|uniref:PstC family ABC transporter permease n=1 Tax=Pseudomonas sp. FW305-E2 TaxID=2075558 RepID=UPI000B4EA53F|nr:MULTISPECIES: ABC transporter permease subunit [Pseudomonas]POA87348.1 phosphate ABC transporter permease subunit PstC [Pseudomonas sp. FW305-E2]
MTLPIVESISPPPSALRGWVFWSAMTMLALLGAAIVFLIVAFLLGEALPLISKGGLTRFFTDEGWWPRDASFNMTPMVVASLYLTIGALLVATPLSLAISLVTTFKAPTGLARLMRNLVELSAAVPTVVYGLWGVSAIVPIINLWSPPGASLLAGVLVVALMIIPTISVLTQSALQGVPVAYVQGAAELGVSENQTLLRIVVLAARQGIFSAMVLGAARAIGETMVVLMVCGSIVQVPTSLFEPVGMYAGSGVALHEEAFNTGQESPRPAGGTRLKLASITGWQSGASAPSVLHSFFEPVTPSGE